jgi:hypothetical protein
VNSETAADYGRYARQLFALARAGNMDAVELFLQEMGEEDRIDLLRLFIEAGGRLSNE